MNVFRYWTGILIVLILAVIFAHPLTANAQVSRYCGSFTVPYGAEIPAPGTGVYSSKAECEGYFNKNCTPDGSVVGQGGYCCNTTGTYYLNGNNVYCGSCIPDGSIVGQGGRCCSRTSYQKGNNVYCGKSAVVATTCTVGGNTLTAGATACGANGDSFEYVCVATGNAVGSAVDDTGAATLQKRTCSSGWTCQGNACVAQNFSACTLPHGTLDTRANMFCCSGKYSATSCSGAQGYYLGGADLPDGTWCTPGDSNLLSGSGGCGRCASKTSSQRSDGKYYCGAAPRVYCNKICPSNSFCNADANGGVCKTSSLNATPGPTPNLQVDLMYTGPKSSITTGQACNDVNGCLCTNQSSLAAPTTVNKGDVCGGAALPAGSAVCSGQCVSGNSCSVAGEQKGIGVCTAGFVCCATTLQTPGLTSQQSACIRNFNQTGLITQDGACGQTLVSKGIVTQTQLNQTAGSQIVVDLGLKAVVSQLDAAATSFERSQIMAKAYNEGKITLAEYTAATAYYATSTTMNALTGGAEYRFQNSVAFSKAQCAPTLASLDCATAVIGAAANGFVATVGTAAAVDQLIGSPLTNTLTQGIQSGLTSSATTAEAKAKALGQLDVTINPQTNTSLPCIQGTSTDPDSVAYEGKKKGDVLGCSTGIVLAMDDENAAAAFKAAVKSQATNAPDDLYYYTEIFAQKGELLPTVVGDAKTEAINSILAPKNSVGAAWKDIFPELASGENPLFMDVTNLHRDPGLAQLGGDWRALDVTSPLLQVGGGGNNTVWFTTYEAAWTYQNAANKTTFFIQTPQGYQIIDPTQLLLPIK